MSESLEDRIVKAMAELEATQEAVANTERELREASFSSVSSDRAVEATVGPQGELTGLTFREGKYREMDPGELEASVLEAADQARTLMNRHVMEAMLPFTQPVGDMPELKGMDVDWAKLFGPQVLEDEDTTDRRRDARLQDDISDDTEE